MFFRVIISIIFSGIIFQTFSCKPQYRAQTAPFALKGVIDLRSWDFDKDGPVPLNGEWKLYPGSLIGSEKNGKIEQSDPAYCAVPGNWSSSFFQGKKLPQTGYVTYQLTILMPGARGAPRVRQAAAPAEASLNAFSLKLFPLKSAYTIFVDGILIGRVGVVGKTPGETIPKVELSIFSIPTPGEKIDIIIEIAHFKSMFPGGITNKLFLGHERDISRSSRYMIAYEFFLLGGILIIAIYHFGMYLYRRKEKTSLYLGLLCLFVTSYSFVQGELFLTYLAPSLSWDFYTRLDGIIIDLIFPLLVIFVYFIFPQEFSKKIVAAVCVFSSGFLILNLIPAVPVFGIAAQQFNVSVFLFGIYAIYVIIFAIIRKRDGSLIFLAGFTILFLSIINDILFVRFNFPMRTMVPFGMMFFILAQALLLARRFSKAFSANEGLAVELEKANFQLIDLNQNLEDRVCARTNELQEARDTLLDDIKLAKKIITALLPQKVPAIKNALAAYMHIPMLGIGGDFVDINYKMMTGPVTPRHLGMRRASDRYLGLFICDVSGHGVPAALTASMVKMSLLSWDEYVNKPVEHLAFIRESLMNKMCENFISAIVCTLDLDSGQVLFANAGHPPFIIVRKNGGSEYVNAKGKIICDFIQPDYTLGKLVLGKGDKIIFYTDGLIEGCNNNVMFGEERLINVVNENHDAQPWEICDNIYNAVKNFTGSSEMEDDFTVMAVEYLGNE